MWWLYSRRGYMHLIYFWTGIDCCWFEMFLGRRLRLSKYFFVMSLHLCWWLLLRVFCCRIWVCSVWIDWSCIFVKIWGRRLIFGGWVNYKICRIIWWIQKRGIFLSLIRGSMSYSWIDLISWCSFWWRMVGYFLVLRIWEEWCLRWCCVWGSRGSGIGSCCWRYGGGIMRIDIIIILQWGIWNLLYNFCVILLIRRNVYIILRGWLILLLRDIVCSRYRVCWMVVLLVWGGIVLLCIIILWVVLNWGLLRGFVVWWLVWLDFVRRRGN